MREAGNRGTQLGLDKLLSKSALPSLPPAMIAKDFRIQRVFSCLAKLSRVDAKLTRREEWQMGKGVYSNGLEVESMKGDAGD